MEISQEKIAIINDIFSREKIYKQDIVNMKKLKEELFPNAIEPKFIEGMNYRKKYKLFFSQNLRNYFKNNL